MDLLLAIVSFLTAASHDRERKVQPRPLDFDKMPPHLQAELLARYPDVRTVVEAQEKDRQAGRQKKKEPDVSALSMAVRSARRSLRHKPKRGKRRSPVLHSVPRTNVIPKPPTPAAQVRRRPIRIVRPPEPELPLEEKIERAHNGAPWIIVWLILLLLLLRAL